MKKNKDFCRDIILVSIGAIIGIVSGLITAHITQKWNFNERTELIANNIRGNVLYELKNNEALKKSLNEYISKEKISVLTGIKWKHSDSIISSVGNSIGYLQSDVIQRYVHYVGMLRQLQYARDQVIKYNNTKLIEKQINYYLGCVDVLGNAGKELLEYLDKYYPEKK